MTNNTNPVDSADQLAEQLLQQWPITEPPLLLAFGEQHYRIEYNNAAVGDQLRDYFSEYCAEDSGANGHRIITIHILQSSHRQPDYELTDWHREGGKSGRKDAFHDLANGRLLYKVRTGMNYVQNSRYHIAYGPCTENISQVINFILTQHMTWLQNAGCVICHASAVATQGRGVAIAAYSGGGKSTLALQLMNNGLDFISNDRLFVRRDNAVHDTIATTTMYGVAKQPRINPGTILNNPTLSTLIAEPRQQQLRAMDKRALWELEEKYDAPIAELYGPNRFKSSAGLHALIILNWSHQSTAQTQLSAVDISEQPQLLEAVMKSPGPFHYDRDGVPWANGQLPNIDHYLQALADIQIYQITGRVDFAAAERHCLPLLH